MNAPFEPLHRRLTASIVLHASVDKVFPLFEPEGERRWEPSWNPEWVFPLTGETRLGMVFQTAHSQPAIWTVIRYEPSNGSITYWRVAPDSHTAQIAINCHHSDLHATEATITYTFTGLSEAGNEYIAHYTEAWFTEWIQSWATAINGYLSNPLSMAPV